MFYFCAKKKINARPIPQQCRQHGKTNNETFIVQQQYVVPVSHVDDTYSVIPDSDLPTSPICLSLAAKSRVVLEITY